MVQLHKCVPDQLEWIVHTPQVIKSNLDKMRIVQVPFVRLSFSYVVNMATMIVFTLSVFTAYAVTFEDVGTRLLVTFTLLLVCVAYKLSLSSFLPNTSYATILDEYTILCIAVFPIVSLGIIIPTFLGDIEQAAYADEVILCLLTSLFAVSLIVMIALHVRKSQALAKSLLPPIPLTASDGRITFQYSIPPFLKHDNSERNTRVTNTKILSLDMSM